MPDHNLDAPDELERILQTAGLLVGRGVQPAEFLKWFCTSVPTMAPQFARAMSSADGGGEALIYGMGRALWNAMPQPSNRYRPRPLPKPDRNGRCPCGSGRKFKQCCAQIEPPREMFESMNLLRYVLDGESKASLKRIDARVMEPAALDAVAHHWAHEGEFERALVLLEPLFEAGMKLPRHAGLLLDTLFDIWPPNYKPQRRRRLAERLADDANPDVACVALHRCIVMLADSGDREEAWVRFHDGIKRYPEDVNFAAVELMLLLREDRVDDARRRAEFWVYRLKRMGTEYHPYAERLLSMVESREDHAYLDQLRTEEPLIDIFARLIEAQPIRVDGYAPHPIEVDEPIVLMPDSALAATERRWSETVNVGKPSLAMHESVDEPLDPEQIVAMLEQDAELLHSFDVLHDISTSLDTLTDERSELSVVLELVLQRAETMLFALVTGSVPTDWVTADSWRNALPDIVCELPWGFLENRPALRLMALHINHLKYRSVGSVERWLPRAQVLLRINPNDNHGYRELVSTELLRQQRPADALTLLDKYSDDAMGAVCMNRVLALYLLGRREEAAKSLRDGGVPLREMRKGITQERYSRPRDSDESRVIIGGRDESWFYRQDMRNTWKEVGAIEWLLQQPAPRKSRRRASRTSGIESADRQSTSVTSKNEGEIASAEFSDGSPASPTLLSQQALRDCADDLPRHGDWLLGLTLAAALTPGAGFDVKRLFKPLLERFENDHSAESGTPAELGNTSNRNALSETTEEEVESIVQLNRALTHFLELYQHFLARRNGTSAPSGNAEPNGSASKVAAAADTGFSYEWVTADLSVVSLDEPAVRLALVSGLVAGIDGNPRGWSSIPTGPRNNVIGPLRLMVASAAGSPDMSDTALNNATLLDLEDNTFQLSREKCLELIIELVGLARLARQ